MSRAERILLPEATTCERPRYIQLGPSGDLDEHGDPKPPKVVRAVFDEKPTIKHIGRKRRRTGRLGAARARR